jgi:hypothetical protein
MNYVSFMRKVNGKPPKVEPKVDTLGFSYTGTMPVRTWIVRDVLDGDATCIAGAFYFGGTPFRSTYWGDVYRNVICLTPDARAYLEWMLEEYS